MGYSWKIYVNLTYRVLNKMVMTFPDAFTLNNQFIQTSRIFFLWVQLTIHHCNDDIITGITEYEIINTQNASTVYIMIHGMMMKLNLSSNIEGMSLVTPIVHPTSNRATSVKTCRSGDVFHPDDVVSDPEAHSMLMYISLFYTSHSAWVIRMNSSERGFYFCCASKWRHNGRDGVANYRRPDC